MSLKPADRYASPQALANDVEHWLADEPVSARKEPFRVRARRWTRKHRTLVTSAVAVLLVATFGSIVAAVLLNNLNRELEVRNQALDESNGRLDRANSEVTATNQRLDVANVNLKTTNGNLIETNRKLDLALKDAETKRQEAVEEKQVAQAVQSFLQFDLLRQANPTDQADRLLSLDDRSFSAVENPSIKELLDRAAAELVSEKIEKKFPKQPLVQAEILQTIGHAYLGVGDFAKANVHLKRACNLYATLGPGDPRMLSCLNHLAMGYTSAGKPDLAISLLEETLKFAKVNHGPGHPVTLLTMNNLAVCYNRDGNLHMGLPLLEDLLKLTKAKLGSYHRNTLSSMNNLALAYHAVGKVDLALPLLEDTLKLTKAKLGPDHPVTLTTMGNLAFGYSAAGMLDLALPLSEETLKARKVKFGSGHPDTLRIKNFLTSTIAGNGTIVPDRKFFVEPDGHCFFVFFRIGLASRIIAGEHVHRRSQPFACAGSGHGRAGYFHGLQEQTLACTANVWEKPVLDRIVFRTAGRIVGHADFQADAVHQALQMVFEDVAVGSVAAAPVA